MSKQKQPAAAKPLPEGIAPRQAKILAALAKARGPMPKAGIVAKSGVHPNWIAEMIGAKDLPPGKERVSGRGHLKLVPAGLVRLVEIPLDGGGRPERCWEITPKGLKALERHQAAAKAPRAGKQAAKARAQKQPEAAPQATA